MDLAFLRLGWLQSKLVEQIGSMLSSFAQRKSEEVSRTVASFNSQLDSGRSAVGACFAELGSLADATTGHLQVRFALRMLHSWLRKLQLRKCLLSWEHSCALLLDTCCWFGGDCQCPLL